MKFRSMCINILVFGGFWAGGNGAFPATASADVSSNPLTVVLTVEHEDKKTLERVLTEFTLSDLQSLPVTEFTTSTIWTAEQQAFTGVEIADLIAHLEIEAEVLHAMALDEYNIDVPMADAVAGGPIIAYFNNGNRMTARDKGPLWIVYPYDTEENFQTEEVYARSVWSLWKIVAR